MRSTNARTSAKTTTVRLLPHERGLLEAAALRRGIGPTVFLRDAALEVARRELGVGDLQAATGIDLLRLASTGQP